MQRANHKLHVFFIMHYYGFRNLDMQVGLGNTVMIHNLIQYFYQIFRIKI